MHPRKRSNLALIACALTLVAFHIVPGEVDDFDPATTVKLEDVPLTC